jgi:hypothetical protein
MNLILFVCLFDDIGTQEEERSEWCKVSVISV